MKRWLLCSLLVGMLALSATAQVLRPVDPNKQADVGNKSVTFPTVDLNTVAQPQRALGQSSVSDKQLQFEQVQRKNVKLETLEHGTVETKTLPQVNFTAKRAAVTDKRHATENVKLGNAPITDRQIKAFQPGGEEELKQQLSEPR